MRAALKWSAMLVLALLVALALFIAFGLNALREPISRAVTQATGRELLIEGDLRSAWSWTHPKFRAEGVRFANADWGSAEHLLRAEAIEASISLLSLLRGRIVVPQVHLEGAELNLEQDAEGRRNWILTQDEDTSSDSRFHIQRLTIDRGQLNYEDAVRDIGLGTELHADAHGLTFATRGRYRGLKVEGAGQAGHVLSVRDAATPFPLKAQAKIGRTAVEVDGTVSGLATLEQFDTQVTLSGGSLEELYRIVNVAFPNTKPYRTAGRLVRDGTVVRYEKFTGKIGESDVAGTIEVDIGGKRPYMRGALASKTLNLADLGALVGTDQPPKKGVLPDMPFDPARWDSVDADVTVRAGTVKRPEQLPIENLSATIRMRERVLRLDPLEFGIAGGKLFGPVVLDGRGDTIRADLRMRVQNLKLAQLFPTIKENKASVGDMGGLLELKARGNSVRALLGGSDGKIGLFIDGGQISQFLMEVAALDLWNAARVKLTGDKPIEIRCAIADFAVKDGLMRTNAFVFDTAVVNVEGGGVVNLKTEEMDLMFNPKPKASSLASLNSPLYLRGTFGEPQVSPDLGRIAAKGLGAIVMGALNPLLAVVPLLKEGKDEDSPCGKLIAEATAAAGAGGTGSRRRPR
jgi:uncharacterized protein involved in outer membrane biogenesis